jgi:hypothetical protein
MRHLLRRLLMLVPTTSLKAWLPTENVFLEMTPCHSNLFDSTLCQSYNRLFAKIMQKPDSPKMSVSNLMHRGRSGRSNSCYDSPVLTLSFPAIRVDRHRPLCCSDLQPRFVFFVGQPNVCFALCKHLGSQFKWALSHFQRLLVISHACLDLVRQECTFGCLVFCKAIIQIAII